MPSPAVYIGLGSNLGDRRALLARGLRSLAEAGFGVTRESALYLTEPVVRSSGRSPSSLVDDGPLRGPVDRSSGRSPSSLVDDGPLRGRVERPPQDWYVNAVAAGHTSLSPARLLDACLQVEKAQGRERTVRDGPRTLDLDILIYGDEQRDEPGLTLPHPRMHERRFVLTPMCELAPDLRHPRLGLTMRELLERCPDRSRVVRLADESGTSA